MRHLAAILCAAFCLTLPQAALAAGGSVSGTIKYEGKLPQMKPIAMSADPDCEKKHTTPPLPDFLVLGDGNTMANIFVNVKSGLTQKEYPSPTTPVMVNQHGCVYEPHVFGVMSNQPVVFKNEDGILHNVHALPKTNRPFNLAMPATMKESPPKSFEKVEEEAFPIKCDVHPWMNSFVKVMSHPFFMITAKDGKYDLKGLPPGTYEIEAWHEKLGTQTASVTVAEGESKTQDFTFKR